MFYRVVLLYFFYLAQRDFRKLDKVLTAENHIYLDYIDFPGIAIYGTFLILIIWLIIDIFRLIINIIPRE